MEADAAPPAIKRAENRSLFQPCQFWMPACICVIAIVAVPIAFIIGAVVGNTQIYRNLSEHQESRIENYLSQHPESFAHISVEHASDGWAYPFGTVPSQSAYDSLDANLHKMFGDELAKRMMSTVEIDAPH